MKFLVALLALASVAYGFVPKLDGRIVGGKMVSINDYPYQVSLRYYDEHICGGSILDKNTIITAAHCVYDSDEDNFSVRVGSTIHELGKSYIVSKVTYHEEYNPSITNNDVAILKLEKPLTYSPTVQPIRLQDEAVEVPVGQVAWVSGWGATREGSLITPRTLRAVDVKFISNDKCQSMYGHIGKITKHMLCAHTLNHDSCQGDSGGPLVSNGKLVGIVSWGYGCARPKFPGVYSKVSDLHSWITANRV